MRALAAAAAVLAFVALALWFGGASLLRGTDADRARDELAARLAEALALPVELGRAELTLLPRPTLRVHDARIGADAALRAQAPLVRIVLSPLALLRGRIEARAFEVDDATLELGALRLERIDGNGSPGASPVFDFSAQSAELGAVRDAHLELSELSAGTPTWCWNASGRLDAVELARVAERALLRGVRGLATGRFEAAGRGREMREASLELESDLALEGRAYEVADRVKIAVDAGGAIALDLAEARVRIGAHFEKPAGVPLRIAGVLEAPWRALRLRDVRIESSGLRAEGRLDLREESVELAAGELDLAALPDAVAFEALPRGGLVHIASARLDASGLAAQGELEIQGETLAASGAYDAASARLELVVGADGAQLAPLAEALWGRHGVSGRLYAHLELAGPLEGRALTGVGDFEVLDGELPGLSFARAAGLAYAEDEPPGLDRFESIAGTFQLAGDRLEIPDLAILQQDASAAVQGRFYLRDRSADLAGIVRFDHPDLGGPSLRPILRMAGTLDALETHISDVTQSEDARRMEASMLELIRKVEADRRGESDRAVSSRAAHGAGR